MPPSRRAAPAAPPAPEAAAGSAERVLKKYPNRRLYDTRTSSYITLIDVKQMVLDGQDFVVRDAKTGEDLTAASCCRSSSRKKAAACRCSRLRCWRR
jgi:PHB/PHA accumulation regulator DNA-binding domain